MAKIDTVIQTMTLGEFRKYQEAELSAIEASKDADRLALLKRAIEFVKESGATDDDAKVVVEVRKDAGGDADLSAVLERLAALEAKTSGAPDADADEAPADPSAKEAGETDVTAALAVEALTAMASRMEALKAKVDSGNLTTEDVDNAFDGQWALRNLLEAAAATLAKREDAPDAEAVKRVIDKLAPVADETPDETPADDPSTKGATGEGDAPEATEWPSDLSAEAMAGQEDEQTAKGRMYFEG